jgi:SAM-dependent methyltransferase
MMKRQFAEQYSNLEQWHWWFRGRRRIIENVLHREIGQKLPLRIVSVGCGPADGLPWLGQFTESKGWVVGLDSDPLHARRLGSGLEYVVGNLKMVPFASGAFDLVLVLDVLEHLEDDILGLREAARLIAPGGLLVVTVPALPSLWGGQDVVSNHYRRYTRRSLLRTFREAGVAEPRINYFNALLFPPIAVVRWTRRAFGLGLRSRSDFDDSRPGLMNEVLAGLFALERHCIGRVPIPVGVSLLATARV